MTEPRFVDATEAANRAIFSGYIGRFDSVTMYTPHPALHWLWDNVKKWDADRHHKEMHEQVEVEMNLKHEGKFWNTQTGRWE